MWIMGRGVVTALVATMLVAGSAWADNNPNGAAFRAVGWFRGNEEITADQIKCEVPTVSSAISDGLYGMGLWNTFGIPNYFFPNKNGPFSDPCGGYIELQNNLIGQAIQIDHVELRFKIPGARRFRQFVPARSGFPIACREFRRDDLFVGALINPIDSNIDQSGSGSPNVAFIQMVPIVSGQTFSCLRGQYGPLSTDVFASLPLVIRATVVGRSDNGDTFRSNTIAYTLNLRHTCGNGRIDDGEVCDPATPFTSCFEACLSGACAFTGRPCRVNPDCPGTCLGADNPSECSCVF